MPSFCNKKNRNYEIVDVVISDYNIVCFTSGSPNRFARSAEEQLEKSRGRSVCRHLGTESLRRRPWRRNYHNVQLVWVENKIEATVTLLLADYRFFSSTKVVEAETEPRAGSATGLQHGDGDIEEKPVALPHGNAVARFIQLGPQTAQNRQRFTDCNGTEYIKR